MHSHDRRDKKTLETGKKQTNEKHRHTYIQKRTQKHTKENKQSRN